MRARSSTAGWAEIQGPRLSTDAGHVAYCERDYLRIVGLDSETDLRFRVPSRWATQYTSRRFVRCGVIDAGWISPTEFLYNDQNDDHLWLVDLADPTAVILKSDIVDFAIAGVPP